MLKNEPLVCWGPLWVYIHVSMYNKIRRALVKLKKYLKWVFRIKLQNEKQAIDMHLKIMLHLLSFSTEKKWTLNNAKESRYLCLYSDFLLQSNHFVEKIKTHFSLFNYWQKKKRSVMYNRICPLYVLWEYQNFKYNDIQSSF